MKKTLSVIVSLILCFCCAFALCACSDTGLDPAASAPANDPSVISASDEDPDTASTAARESDAAEPLASREAAQDYLKNAENVWFVGPALSVQGQKIYVTGLFKDPQFEDEGRPTPNTREAALMRFHEFDLSEYPETDEDAQSREHCYMAGLEAGGSVCFISVGEMPDPEAPLNTIERVLTFEFPDGSRFSVELPDICPPDGMDQPSGSLQTAILMVTEGGRMYERTDTGGDLTVYDQAGGACPSSAWGAAYVRRAVEIAVEYGEKVSAAGISWDKKAAFEDGGTYDFAFEGDDPMKQAIYVRPYEGNVPSDTVFLLGGFDDEQSQMTCSLHTYMALFRDDEAKAQEQKQTLTITADYSDIGEYFVLDRDMEIYTDDSFSEPIRAQRSDPVSEFLYTYTFSLDEVQDTYWVRPGLVSVNENQTPAITSPLEQGAVIQYEGADWMILDEVLIQGRLLTVKMIPCEQVRGAVPDQVQALIGGEEAAQTTAEVSFDASNVMDFAQYTFIISDNADLDGAQLLINAAFVPKDYTAVYSCDSAELIVGSP